MQVGLDYVCSYEPFVQGAVSLIFEQNTSDSLGIFRLNVFLEYAFVARSFSCCYRGHPVLEMNP